MDAHFLTEIEIEEFKCFKGFSASGFKRVNLIGGKNNIGKTALMEAIFVNVRAKNVNKMNSAIFGIKCTRESINLLSGERKVSDTDLVALINATTRYSARSNVAETYFSIEAGDAVKTYHYRINGSGYVINAKDFSFIFEVDLNIMRIDSSGLHDALLSDVYQFVQKRDRESELDRYVNEFDSSIDKFKVIGDKPQCRTNGKYRAITEFGDGLRSYISMICALYACENGYLFIDEIDNGIHYTQLDRLWEIILTLSKQNNCQVFATTHSREMIESFARVAKKRHDEEVSYTLLVKDKQQELKTLTHDFEMLDYSMRMEHEVR